MAVLTRDQIRAAQDRKPVYVTVPEWGGEVAVRGLSGTAKGDYEMWAAQVKMTPEGHLIMATDGKTLEHEEPTLDRLKAVKYKLITLCVVGPDGEPIFDETDMAWLAEKSGAATERVFDVASALSGITGTDVNTLAGVVTDLPNSPDGSASSAAQPPSDSPRKKRKAS